MDKEAVLFTKPEELIEYLDENDLLMDLSSKDSEILLNYMEGHGYGLGELDGKLVRVDIGEEYGEVMEYSIDDAIDVVCEWNYELIQEAKERRDSPENFLDFCSSQGKYESLREDEKTLDKMFYKTRYGKEINELAERLAQEAVNNMKASKKMDSVVIAVTEEIQQYSTDKKGKVR